MYIFVLVVQTLKLLATKYYSSISIFYFTCQKLTHEELKFAMCLITLVFYSRLPNYMGTVCNSVEGFPLTVFCLNIR